MRPRVIVSALLLAGALTGCSRGTCTYRNTADDTLYQLTVDHGPGGWYVSAVTPET